MNKDWQRIEARVRLIRLAIGGWAAQSLFAANDLGIFELLARRGPLSADEVAMALGAHVDATARLLGALTAMDLLRHGQDGRYANGMAASEFLLPEKDESMATWLSLIGHWTQTFGQLADSVRSGHPAELPEEHLGQSADYTRSFVLGMHDYALGPGRELARSLDLSDRRSLLDVGGGAGTYSMLLAEAHLSLTCTVWDLPAAVDVAREVIARRGLSERIAVAAGDYHVDVFPYGHDAILISNTLHQEDRAMCVSILRNAYEALASGGLVVVHAMFLNERGDGPLWPALHNLLMLLVYRGGRAYTVGQTFEMLIEAGFSDPRHHTMSDFNAGSYVTARKA